MLKKTHVSVGVIASGVAAATMGVSITPLFLISAAVGSLFPDMDHPNGAINNKILLVQNGLFKLITYLAFSGGLLTYGPRYLDKRVILYTTFIFIAIAFSRHRSITHSLLGTIGMALYMIFIKSKYGIDIVMPFSIGIISHLILDMLNPDGIELLWPYKENYKFPITFYTGGIGEYVVFIGFLFMVGKYFRLI